MNSVPAHPTRCLMPVPSCRSFTRGSCGSRCRRNASGLGNLEARAMVADTTRVAGPCRGGEGGRPEPGAAGRGREPASFSTPANALPVQSRSGLDHSAPRPMLAGSPALLRTTARACTHRARTGVRARAHAAGAVADRALCDGRPWYTAGRIVPASARRP